MVYKRVSDFCATCFCSMSLQFDWEALKPFVQEKIGEAISKVPIDANPMLRSKVRLVSMDLGTSPPFVALTRISSLTLKQHKISAIFRYRGNAIIEIKCDLNVNALGARSDHSQSKRMMGMIYTSAPMIIPCRFLLSNFDICFKVNITHGETTFIEFEEPPVVNFTMDSNIGKLGYIFNLSLRRIQKIIRMEYAKLPPKIEIKIPQA